MSKNSELLSKVLEELNSMSVSDYESLFMEAREAAGFGYPDNDGLNEISWSSADQRTMIGKVETPSWGELCPLVRMPEDLRQNEGHAAEDYTYAMAA